MPIYEYRCDTCEKVHEVIQKFSDAPLTECPECKASVTKMVSLGSFALKGTGWYTTDYKRKGAEVKPATTPAATSAGSSEGKAEGKVEAKAAVDSKPATETKTVPAPKSESKPSTGTTSR